jgi:hypothetical protein
MTMRSEGSGKRHRRELAGLHELGEHGGLAELLGKLRHIADNLRPFQLPDELGTELGLRLPCQRRRGRKAREGQGTRGERRVQEELAASDAW